MITGGADSKIHPLSLVRMSLLDQMSRWQGEPARACRPFDRRRDGWVPGEGAGILILEEREHALRRGARIYGEILGFGSGCDASPGGGLDPEGVGTEIAISAALRDAGLEPVRGRPRQRPRLRPRVVATWPRPGPSTASSAPAGRPGHGAEGLHGQPRLRLRRGRADRQPARRQPRPDPRRRSTATSPTPPAASTSSAARPGRPTTRPS